MNRSFYRKVGFGLAVNDDMPNDPLKWAISQLEKVPNLNWKGPIYSLEEMMNFHGKIIKFLIHQPSSKKKRDCLDFRKLQ